MAAAQAALSEARGEVAQHRRLLADAEAELSRARREVEEARGEVARQGAALGAAAAEGEEGRRELRQRLADVELELDQVTGGDAAAARRPLSPARCACSSVRSVVLRRAVVMVVTGKRVTCGVGTPRRAVCVRRRWWWTAQQLPGSLPLTLACAVRAVCVLTEQVVSDRDQLLESLQQMQADKAALKARCDQADAAMQLVQVRRGRMHRRRLAQAPQAFGTTAWLVPRLGGTQETFKDATAGPHRFATDVRDVLPRACRWRWSTRPTSSTTRARRSRT